MNLYKLKLIICAKYVIYTYNPKVVLIGGASDID